MKNKFGLWILILFIFMSIPFAYGEEASTEKKEGKSGAFDFVESTPGNSAKDVELDGQIMLLFNKNVVNFTVKDNNEKCFSIKNAKNEEVPIDVIFADDQIEPDKKREIILRPKKPFDENTAYVIHISPALKAKNGDSLDRDVAISFTTLSLQPKEDSPPPEDKPKEKPVEKNTEKPVSTTPVQEQEKVTTDKGKEADNADKDKDVVKDNSKDDSDVPVSSDDPEKGETGLSKEEDSGPESSIVSDDANDDIDEQKDSGVTSKKYIWIIAAGVVLALIFVFRKKA